MSTKSFYDVYLESNDEIRNTLFNMYIIGAQVKHKFWGHLLYLPLSLHKDYISQQILETNHILCQIEDRRNLINRVTADLLYSTDPIAFRGLKTFIKAFIGKRKLSEQTKRDFADKRFNAYKRADFNRFIDRAISSDKKVFEPLIQYIGKVFYYNELLYHLDQLEQGHKLNIPNQNQLQTTLTDTQRGKLYDLLVNGGYIAPETNKDGFIWAFGGESDDYRSFQLQWLKNQNLAVYLVNCLCFDQNVKIQSNYLSKAEKIFSINNPRQIRKGYENNNTGKPNGYQQIDMILEEAKK